MERSLPRAAALALAGLVALLAGCGGSSSSSRDVKQVLSDGKQTVDATPALHFKLTSENAGGSGLFIKDGEGDAKRPSGFVGSFDVSRSGLLVPINVLSTQGSFYVRLPFTPGYQKTDPAQYGFADPGQLLDPKVGLSSLLTATKTASLGDRDRLNGELLDEVDGTLPGQKVKDLLTSADPSQDVVARFGIDADSHEVRRVVLTGPFFEKGRNSTFTVILDHYGESVSVTPPS